MKAALLEGLAEKTFAIVFNTGDEVAAGLLAFAKEHHVTAAHFTAIGAFSSADGRLLRLGKEGVPQDSD